MKTVNILAIKKGYIDDFFEDGILSVVGQIFDVIDVYKVKDSDDYLFPCTKDYLGDYYTDKDKIAKIEKTKHNSFTEQVKSLIAFLMAHVNLDNDTHLNIVLHANDFPESEIIKILGKPNYEYRIPDEVTRIITEGIKIKCNIYLFSHQSGSKIYEYINEDDTNNDFSDFVKILDGIQEKNFFTFDQVQERINKIRETNNIDISDEDLEKTIKILKLCQEILDDIDRMKYKDICNVLQRYYN